MRLEFVAIAPVMASDDRSIEAVPAPRGVGVSRPLRDPHRGSDGARCAEYLADPPDRSGGPPGTRSPRIAGTSRDSSAFLARASGARSSASARRSLALPGRAAAAGPRQPQRGPAPLRGARPLSLPPREPARSARPDRAPRQPAPARRLPRTLSHGGRRRPRRGARHDAARRTAGPRAARAALRLAGCAPPRRSRCASRT